MRINDNNGVLLFTGISTVYHYRIVKACNRFVKVHGTNVVSMQLSNANALITSAANGNLSMQSIDYSV